MFDFRAKWKKELCNENWWIYNFNKRHALTLPIADLKLRKSADWLDELPSENQTERENESESSFLLIRFQVLFVYAEKPARQTRFDNESNSLILCFGSKQILNQMESKLFAYKYSDRKFYKTNRILRIVNREHEETNNCIYKMKSKWKMCLLYVFFVQLKSDVILILWKSQEKQRNEHDNIVAGNKIDRVE